MKTLTQVEAMEREARMRLYGVDPIEDFTTLLQVVQTLYTENANIVLDWKNSVVKITHEAYDGDWATYRWI